MLEGGNGQKVSLEIVVSSRSYSLMERHIPENRKYKIVIEVEMSCQGRSEKDDVGKEDQNRLPGRDDI